MRKTHNFFLAVFGFFLLSVVFFIFVEIAWVDRNRILTVLSAPPTPIGGITTVRAGDPDWLVPSDQIAFYCVHPWVIPGNVHLLNQGIADLIETGLSECYRLAGERALESHLWHQGVTGLDGDRPSFIGEARDVELYFDYDTDFQRLGLEPPPTVDMSGTIVHDLNGDAAFNPDEPVIHGARICINRDPLSPLCVSSGSDGKYAFNGILPGAWRFRLSSPSAQRLSAFKYVNQLIEANHHFSETTVNGYTIAARTLNLTEFNPIEDEILLLVEPGIERDFFMMQEWATYFAASKDAGNFQTQAHYDFDLRLGATRIFSGEPGPTYDQHDGLDASCPRGTEIVSVAEGLVVAIFNDSTVAIRHPNQLISVYGHGDPLVEENQFVSRGYPVALCNNHLTESAPHLHFAVWRSTPWLHKVNYGLPPFADLVNTEERWVANRHPLEADHYVYLLQGGRGIWTEINQPHLPNVGIEEE